MANQPEVTNYDVGVYQLALTDPVQGGAGGVSNAPLLNLANRTNWLYTNLNLLIEGTTIPPTVAPLNSPPLTGTPTTPTPPLGDNSFKISNTAWVQSLVSGVLSLSVAGGTNVVLSAVQAGNGTLNLTGALTANIAVILPSVAGKWIVENNTTGAFTLTVKTAAGTGVAVTQGKNQSVYGDATNIYLASNDFSSIQLTGTPTSVTPPVGDQTTKVATTNFAYQLKNGVVAVPVGGGANVVLTPAQYGNGILLLTGALTAAIEVIVPPQGGTYVIANETTGAFGLTLATAAGGSAKTAVLPQGQSVVAYCDGTNVVLAGAAASSSFAVHTFTATAGETDFACPYTPGNILVIQNGSTVASSNITATDGANVIFNSTVETGDEIQVIAFSSFTVANAVTWDGGTMLGALQLFGGDTGTTAPQFDNSLKLATTAFVKAAGFNLSGISTALAGATLSNTAAGGLTILAAGTTSLPSVGSFGMGATIMLFSSVAGCVIKGNGSDLINVNGSTVTSLTLNVGDTLVLTVGNAVGQWLAVGGSVQLGYSNSLTGTHGSSGYQKFPNGLIIQWGQGSTSSSGTISQTLPIAFPNGWAGGFACVNQVGPYFGVVNVLGSTTIEITGYISSSGAAIGVGCEFTWFAIGY